MFFVLSLGRAKVKKRDLYLYDLSLISNKHFLSEFLIIYNKNLSKTYPSSVITEKSKIIAQHFIKCALKRIVIEATEYFIRLNQCTGTVLFFRKVRLQPCLQCKKPVFDPWVRKISWRREWLPTPVFLPGESHGQRSLGGLWSMSLNELDTIEATRHTHI